MCAAVVSKAPFVRESKIRRETRKYLWILLLPRREKGALKPTGMEATFSRASGSQADCVGVRGSVGL